MSMSNYLSVRIVASPVMATGHGASGLDHLTVVPENYDAETAGGADGEPGAQGDSGTDDARSDTVETGD